MKDTIVIIGKIIDVSRYKATPGYEVFLPDIYNHSENITWLQKAICAGRWIQTVSENYNGTYLEEYNILNQAMKNGFEI